MDAPWTALLAWDAAPTLAPPLVAIVLALLTRRVVVSLAAAALVGALVAARGGPLNAIAILFRTGSEVVLDTDNLTVAAFSLLVAAMVGVMEASGGTRALVARIERLAKGRRGTMVASWLSGGVVFFDDYANCLVVGSAMGPLADRTGVSRAKLAYIVDATAAPVASLAIISTWVGYEVGLFGDALAGLDPELVQLHAGASGFGLFLQALPYRFYCILTLLFVGMVAITGRDFGPMAVEEARAAARPRPAPSASDELKASPWLAALPVLTLIVVTFSALWWDGWRSLGADAVGAPLFDVFGAADAFGAMLLGSVVSLTVAVVLSVVLRALAPRAVPGAAGSAAKSVLQALVVLYLAWTLGSLIKQIGAPDFIAAAIDGRVPLAVLPGLVFVLSAATAFSTGSSFFTMGALIPIVIPVAVLLGGGGIDHVVVIASAAAVLDGAVLGDHASPISDTTILSSLGSRVDVVTHVRTQLPYVAVVGATTIVVCALPAALGVSPWVLVAVGGLVCFGALMTLGRVPQSA